MTRGLNGRTAIVTGAARGIGRAIARALAREGAHVFLAGRGEADLKLVADAIAADGGTATAVPLDVRDAGAIEGVVERAVDETGTLNIMVNNAGLSYPGAIADGRVEHWREMFEVNVIALLEGAKAAINAMRAGRFEGHIVNISSIAARGQRSGVYGATKAAVNAIGENLRGELQSDRIRIVQIMPGMILTDFARNYPAEVVNQMLDAFGEKANFRTGGHVPTDVADRMRAKSRDMFGDPDDIARAVLFAVTQPIEVDIFEMVVRPGKDLP